MQGGCAALSWSESRQRTGVRDRRTDPAAQVENGDGNGSEPGDHVHARRMATISRLRDLLGQLVGLDTDVQEEWLVVGQDLGAFAISEIHLSNYKFARR